MSAAGRRADGADCLTFPGTRSLPTRSGRAAVSAALPGGGLVDLSVGTPVDPTPAVVQDALRAAADAPGLPPDLGDARRCARRSRDWFARRRGVPGPRPRRGAADDRLQGARRLAADPARPGRRRRRGLPGRRLPDLRRRRPARGGRSDGGRRPRRAGPGDRVDRRQSCCGSTALATRPARCWASATWPRSSHWARRNNVVVASDECYAELDWRELTPRAASRRRRPSILDPRVTGGSHEGLLAVYSLSKQSNLAGYRAAFVAGDPALVRRLLEVRKHAGMIMPAPVQHAMAAALDDDAHVAEQQARLRPPDARLLQAAVEGAGLRIDDSEAGPVPVVHPGRGRLGDRRLAGRPRHPRRAGHLLRRGRWRARADRA